MSIEEAVDNCGAIAGNRCRNDVSKREARLSKKGENNLTVPQQEDETK